MAEPAARPQPDGGRKAADDRALLVLNAGSSSLKYEMLTRGEATVARGAVSRIGTGQAAHVLALEGGRTLSSQFACPDHQTAVRQAFLDLAQALGGDWTKRVEGVGHRVVHGGVRLWKPTLVDDAVVDVLERQIELAPLHNRPSVRAIRAARALLPGVPQVAVFDTGFHHDLPPVARAYALPLELAERFGIRRFGFHGISCQYLVRRIAELRIEPSKRTIVCHLGAGASLTAVLDGRSVDTSMGLTPLEGLVMATRAGNLDPGLVLFLERHTGLGPDALDHVLERESGLLGLSGISGDYAELEARARAGEARAQLALEIFAYRARGYLGAYTAVLGGVDLVVFSGGIGEHSAGARAAIVEPLAALGWRLDRDRNAAGEPERMVSPPGAAPGIWVIPTREELAIARDAWEVIGAGAAA